MRSSYSNEDVNILLKDITGLTEPLSAEVRERKIQSGTHYCEMLPLEYRPSSQYMAAYQNALECYGTSTAEAIGILAEKLYRKKGKDLTVVSLARAGIPIGILVKRYLKNKYGLNVAHYAISIIRGRGIDRNAVEYILKNHSPESVQFVDGWIGKGAILTQLKEALAEYPLMDSELGVVSDPANLTELCGTHEDILIPSSCLNATVTGLISRTFLRDDLIGEGDFHGAAYFGELEKEDLSGEFLQCIEAQFTYDCNQPSRPWHPAEPNGQDKANQPCQPERNNLASWSSAQVVRDIVKEYGVGDINFVKPGIGETTRVLLRRIPWKVIINQEYAHADQLKHIYQLAAEKRVPCEISRVKLGNYKACGIIKELADV